MKKPQIFLSYSWSSEKKLADKIYNDLTFVGVNILKDDHELRYTDKLSDFMQRIRKSDFALLLISDTYLKSVNCMHEAMQLNKDINVWDKILPVLCDGTEIFTSEARARYVLYWQDKSHAVEAALRDLKPVNAIALYSELKNLQEIAQNIDAFLSILKDKLLLSPEELFEKFYTPLAERIGTPLDMTNMIELLPISYIKDPVLRLKKIQEFIQTHPIAHSLSFAILGGCYRDLNQNNLAIQWYKKSLALDGYDAAVWNNLGQIHEKSYSNYALAKECYEKSIVYNPRLDTARINLAELLSRRFNDSAGAKRELEAVIAFDENNAKAHNNLAVLYRGDEFLDIDQAEKHLLIGVRQNNLEALMNYANFLKVVKHDFESGNFYYFKAKELDKDNLYSEIIDLLIESKNA